MQLDRNRIVIRERGWLDLLDPDVIVAPYLHEPWGGTLTALRRPFVYFPLEGQFDQCVYVSERLARQQAGIRMLYSRTMPSLLADVGLANIFRPPVWPPIRCDGARTAALLLDRMLRAVPDARRPESAR